MKVFCLSQDSREAHTNLTDSFRLERGGQFVSGFQFGVLVRLVIGYNQLNWIACAGDSLANTNSTNKQVPQKRPVFGGLNKTVFFFNNLAS